MEVKALTPARRTAGNEATGVLKLLAVALMFCDHAGKMLLPEVPEMRLIGRLAFPLYAWMLVVGASHTRSMGRYLLRILGVGAASQYLYMLTLAHTTPVAQVLGFPWYQPNIMLTPALGLAAIWAYQHNTWAGIAAAVAAMFLAEVLHADYGWKAILLIVGLYAVRGSREGITCFFLSFCLYWGTTAIPVSSFFGLRIHPTGVAATLLDPWLRRQALAVLVLPLILWNCPWRLRLPQWVGYALYPAHLLLLFLLERLL